MPIFIHTPNGIALAEDINATTIRAEPMDEAGLGGPGARLGGVEDPLGSTDTVDIPEVKAHIGIHRCRRVRVTINFVGEHKERRFVPSATIQAVRRWAIGAHGFNLSAEEQPEHEVGVCSTGVIADRDERVGALATRCALCLDLAPTNRFRG
jgi:hypothetical protein